MKIHTTIDIHFAFIVFTILLTTSGIGCDRDADDAVEMRAAVADAPASSSPVLSEQGERIRKLIIDGKLTGADDLLKSMMDDSPEKRPLQLLWVCASVDPMGDKQMAWDQPAKVGYDEASLGNHRDRLSLVCKETAESHAGLIAESLMEIIFNKVGKKRGVMLSDETFYKMPQALEFMDAKDVIKAPNMLLGISQLGAPTQNIRAWLQQKFILFSPSPSRDAPGIQYEVMLSVASLFILTNDFNEPWLASQLPESTQWFEAARSYMNNFGQWGAGTNVLYTARDFSKLPGSSVDLAPRVDKLRQSLLDAGRYSSVLGVMLMFRPDAQTSSGAAMQALELVLSHAIAKGDDASIDRALVAVAVSGQIHDGPTQESPLKIESKAYAWSDSGKADSRFTKIKSLLAEANKRRPTAAQALLLINL